MDAPKRYNTYSTYLKTKYGEKVYKLPINLPVTCPNRDGTCGKGGCIFCGEKGAGFEELPNTLPVEEQIAQNMAYIGRKYKARKFIAYFQNFTNTYMPAKKFEDYMWKACRENVVELCISTRPDCIAPPYLEILDGIRREKGVNISVELGVQTVNYHTLKKINRGHSLAEVIDAMSMLRPYEFETCAHLILNLPWDDAEDARENARVVSALGFHQVKLHALYIVKGTVMEEMYTGEQVEMITAGEYVDRVVTFLEYLDPGIVVQRLIGRAPEEDTLFANWNTSWWKIKDWIEERMEVLDTRQGSRFTYLGGAAVRKYL